MPTAELCFALSQTKKIGVPIQIGVLEVSGTTPIAFNLSELS